MSMGFSCFFIYVLIFLVYIFTLYMDSLIIDVECDEEKMGEK